MQSIYIQDMELIWLAASSSPHQELPARWNCRIIPHRTAMKEVFAPDSAVAIIVEVIEPEDSVRAFDTLRLGLGIPIVIFQPQVTVSESVRWVKAGASNVTGRPDEIDHCLEALREENTPVADGKPLVGSSAAIQSLEAEIRLVADRQCSVLIEGETGTGKEVTARQIHESGRRSRGPWVAVNCGAIPEQLLEAELFGHVRGAFTGAIQARAGKFEAANHGTIFLDEIGEMPVAVQAKLLRVLQEREVERLGGNERIKLDVRVIAATNADLRERVQNKLFREDLYYRLHVFRIELPPLRARTDDIPLLARHFVAKVCAQERLPAKRIDSGALDRLMAYHWPGNVRELQNIIEAAVVVSGDRPTIFPGDLRIKAALPAAASAPIARDSDWPAQGIDYQSALEEFERNLLTQALVRARGNKTAAADLLGLKRTTLSAKMKVIGTRRHQLVA